MEKSSLIYILSKLKGKKKNGTPLKVTFINNNKLREIRNAINFPFAKGTNNQT